MAQLTELNKISIAIIVYYCPALLVAVYLCMAHGWGRSSGWLYLVIFSTARILGSILDLASINDPTNTSLQIGSNTLLNIGLSPLMLVMLGLLSRILDSIRFSHDTPITPRHMRLIQVLVIIGLILGIAGGVTLGNDISDDITKAETTGQPLPTSYTVPTETVAGMGCTVAGFGLLALATVTTALDVSAAAPGEKRLLLAIVLALPFVLVRLVFSSVASFGTDPHFRLYFGAPDYANYLLGMAIIMEMVAVIVFEGTGLTLQRREKVPQGYRENENIRMRRMGNA